MPQLIHFLLSQFGYGVVLGLICAEAILLTDAFELARLIAASGSDGALTLLFFGQAAVLFGTANMSVAVMNLR